MFVISITAGVLRGEEWCRLDLWRDCLSLKLKGRCSLWLLLSTHRSSGMISSTPTLRKAWRWYSSSTTAETGHWHEPCGTPALHSFHGRDRHLFSVTLISDKGWALLIGRRCTSALVGCSYVDEDPKFQKAPGVKDSEPGGSNFITLVDKTLNF